MVSKNMYEGVEMATKRERVLAELQTIARNWILSVYEKKGLGDQVTAENCMRLPTFGSYRLNVHLPGADMDVLCVAPRNVEREEFFNDFSDVLREEALVSDVQVVHDALVPIIMFKFDDIEIDLAFCRLPTVNIPADFNLQDDRILKNMDEKSIVSINGPRVTDEVLNCVPNRETFATVMRLLKLWAQRRGVYKNAVGFLGGIALEILLAQVCQRWPNAAPSTLVNKFFFFYDKWEFGGQNPVKLVELIPDT